MVSYHADTLALGRPGRSANAWRCPLSHATVYEYSFSRRDIVNVDQHGLANAARRIAVLCQIGIIEKMVEVQNLISYVDIIIVSNKNNSQGV